MSFADAWNYGYLAGYFAEYDPSKYNSMHYLFSTPWIYGAVICAVIAYLFGSINCGLLISKIYGTDIRKYGSGNAGATNMTRTFGKKAGIMTFVGDFLKTALGLLACRMVFGTEGVFIAGIFCILGHAYPIYFKFKGGKGVVCMAAVVLFAEPLVFAIMITIFAIILFGFKMVSFASVMCMVIYPYMLHLIGNWYEAGYGIHIIYAMMASVLVIFLHRKNIVRIFNHTESKIFQKKNQYSEDDDYEECEE